MTALTDTITIPDTPWHDALVEFVTASALIHCTTVTRHTHATVVTAAWPVAAFSSGEKTLWRLLGSLAYGDLAQAFDRLDARSLGALFKALAAVERRTGVTA